MKIPFVTIGLLFVACYSLSGQGFFVLDDRMRMPVERPVSFPIETVRHNVEVKIKDQFAITRVSQELRNTTNRQLEGTFFFPVPQGASIDNFRMEIDGKMTEAELLPAKEARKIYEDIVRSRKDPALLEYMDRDAFRMRIFPIEARSSRKIELTYSHLLPATAGLASYRYPLSTQKLSSRTLPELSIRVVIESDKSPDTIYSPSHTIEKTLKQNGGVVVGFEAENLPPGPDFELLYSIEGGNTPRILTHRTGEDDGYFMALFTPDMPENKPQPKDVIFVVDTSGSMSGGKLDQARKALTFCIENLNEEDRFEVIRFSTEADPLFDGLRAVDSDSREQAALFVKKWKPLGGTAIEGALSKALKLADEEKRRPSLIVFLTDGLPTVGETDEKKLLTLWKEKTAHIRIFPFGIGADVNTLLLDGLAEQSRAFSQYVLADEDLELKLSGFFSRLKNPALVRPELKFIDGVRVSRIYPDPLPDLFHGDQLVVVGRYAGSGSTEVELTGLHDGEKFRTTTEISFPKESESGLFIPKLWASRRVGYLLDEIRLNGDNKELREEATALAREYGIVTPYTAYLILEDEDRRRVPEALRSFSSGSAGAGMRERAGAAWRNFSETKSGADSVRGSVAQNALKHAQNSAVTTPASTGFADSSLGPDAIPEQATAGGQVFYKRDKQWVDPAAARHSDGRQVRVQFASEEYFDLVRGNPQASAQFALGQNLLFVLNNTVYEIHE